MKRFQLLTLFFLLGHFAMAQQYPLFTNFMMNKYGYNPAIHMDSTGICADLVYRRQWTGLEGAPETMIAGVRGRVNPLPVGVGGYFFSDRAGVMQRTGGFAMFNLVKPLGPNTRLSLGGSVGMYTLRLGEGYQASDDLDPLLPLALEGKRFFNFNAGAYLEHRDFYVGFSVPQIEQQKRSFSDTFEDALLQRHYYALIGYRYPVKEKIWLEPMGLVKYVQHAPLQWDAGLKLILNKFWIGGSYRSSAAATAMAGVNLGNIELAYAFDLATTSLNSVSNGSHELTLHACFGKQKDSDGDGCPDRVDKCPDRPGPKDNDCCPEESPDEALAGIADTDGDGVPDAFDQCPTLPGLKELQGCPFGDRDGDGIRNDIDECPDLPGVASNQGCPVDDRDLDGIVDKFDRCPDEAGSFQNSGCPGNDADGDGIDDLADKCPNTKGAPGNNGCPLVTDGEKEILRLAIRNLYFDTNKFEIWQKSYVYLDRLSEVMVRHPDWKLKLEGHTDARASEEYNLALSKRRSEAVMNYLVIRGVKREQLVVEFYGETTPAVSNSSEGGMQLNRRVEMAFYFD